MRWMKIKKSNTRWHTLSPNGINIMEKSIAYRKVMQNFSYRALELNCKHWTCNQTRASYKAQLDRFQWINHWQLLIKTDGSLTAKRQVAELKRRFQNIAKHSKYHSKWKSTDCVRVRKISRSHSGFLRRHVITKNNPGKNIRRVSHVRQWET